jgi:murein DD-endopeptidase MepM/ murein hydrolase activator NlpD
MRKIRPSQQMALTLKVYWRLMNVRRTGRLVLQASAVIILAVAILTAWKGFGLDQGSADAINSEPQIIENPADLSYEPIPLHSVRETAAETTGLFEPEAPTTFPGIDPQITGQWRFPLKTEPYTPPAGVFGSGRTSRRIHAGIDLYAPTGTGVYAMTSGRVFSIGIFYQGLKSIVVENDDGTTLHYTELAPLVEIGDRIEQGQLIARLRRNNDGTCMLHLEIYAAIDDEPVIQDWNKDDFLYVPFETKSYNRRRDLVDPSAIYSLQRQ